MFLPKKINTKVLNLSKPISIRVNKDTFKRLERAADENHLQFGTYLRISIERWVAKYGCD